MAGPWEDYGSGPWSDYQKPEAPNAVVDTVKGIPNAVADRWANILGMGDTGGPYMGPDLSVMPIGPEAAKKSITGVTGDLYKPQTPEGRIWSNVAATPFDPTSYIGPGGPLKAAASSAVATLFGDTAHEALPDNLKTGGSIAASLLAPTFSSKAAAAAKAPTDAVLRAEGGAGSQAVRDALFATDMKTSNNFITKTISDLDKRNLNERVAPETNAILSDYANRPLTGKDYDELKLRLNEATDNAAVPAKKALYEHIDNLKPSQAYGDVAQFKADFNDAKANYAAGMRGKTIEDLTQNAVDKAAQTYSGLNEGNNIRQALRPLTKNRNELARTSGFNAPEIAKMRQITQGTLGSNALRYGGNILGGGGGLAALLTGDVFGGEGGSPGAAVLAGLGMRKGYNAIQRSRANALSEMVRARSPLGGGVKTPTSNAIPDTIQRLINMVHVLGLE